MKIFKAILAIILFVAVMANEKECGGIMIELMLIVSLSVLATLCVYEAAIDIVKKREEAVKRREDIEKRVAELERLQKEQNR